MKLQWHRSQNRTALGYVVHYAESQTHRYYVARSATPGYWDVKIHRLTPVGTIDPIMVAEKEPCTWSCGVDFRDAKAEAQTHADDTVEEN